MVDCGIRRDTCQSNVEFEYRHDFLRCRWINTNVVTLQEGIQKWQNMPFIYLSPIYVRAAAFTAWLLTSYCLSSSLVFAAVKPFPLANNCI